MNHKMNLKTALVSALLLGQSWALAMPSYLQAAKLGSRIVSMDNQTPVPLAPIRTVKGTIQIDRYETTWDASQNRPDTKITPVCRLVNDVNVFDLRNAKPDDSYYMNPARITCTDTIDNTAFEIIASSSLYFLNVLSNGMPPVKMFSTYAYILLPDNFTKEIPVIHNQDSFTTDLNQVNFGAISFAHTGVSCLSTEGPSNAKTSDGLPPNCMIINPIAYQAIWTAEDQP